MGFFSSIGKAIGGAVKSVGKALKKVAMPAIGAAAALIPGAGAVMGVISSIGKGGQVVAEAVEAQGGVGPALANLGNGANQTEGLMSLGKSLLPVAALGVGVAVLAGAGGRRRVGGWF